MLPIILDSDQISVVLVGAGEALERRYQLLKAADVENLKVFTTDTKAGIKDAVSGLPVAEDLDGISVLFIAGLASEPSTKLATEARTRGILVNAEDNRPLCDFHVPASVRRGDLLLTASTGGGAPGLARRLRQHLEAGFGEEWGNRVAELSAERTKWQDEGLDFESLATKSNEWIDRKGWLK